MIELDRGPPELLPYRERKQRARTVAAAALLSVLLAAPTVRAASISISHTAAACGAAVEGHVRYQAPNVEVCNGTSWVTLGGGGSSQWVTNGSDIYYNAGNVGIGTTTPSGVLHAAHSTFASTTLLERSGQTSDAVFSAARVLATKTTDMGDGFGSALGFSIQDNAATINPIAYVGAVRSGADNSGDLTFATYSSGSVTEKVRIDKSGNVGIGTTSPSEKLEVSARAKVQGIYAGEWASATRIEGTTAQAMHVTAPPSQILHLNSNGGVSAFGGNVGIGTTSPVADLEVFGDQGVMLRSVEGGPLYQYLYADEGDDNADRWLHAALASNGNYEIQSYAPGSWATRLAIDSNGNIGIGTTAPSARLHVAGTGTLANFGNGKIGVDTRNSTYMEFRADDNGSAEAASAGDYLRIRGLLSGGVGYLQVVDETKVLLWVGDNGNVGVGTTAPSALLTLHGGAASPVIRGANDNLRFESEDSAFFVLDHNSDNVDTESFFWTKNGTASTLMTLTETGRLGIGTAAPASPLHVVIDADSAFRIADAGTNAVYAYAESGDELYLGANGAYQARFHTDGTASFTGKVGMGTASPGAAYRLTLAGDATTAPVGGIQFNNGAGRFYLGPPTTTDAANIEFWNSANGHLRFATNDVARLHIAADGNVGIGTTSPGYKLEVNGTAYATGAAGALSDARHKQNIKALADGALNSVMKLKPVTFAWKDPKDDGMKGEQVGFIAQEVEKVLPAVVLTREDTDKTKGLKYTELIPILTKALQEQQEQIEELEQRLEALTVAE